MENYLNRLRHWMLDASPYLFFIRGLLFWLFVLASLLMFLSPMLISVW